MRQQVERIGCPALAPECNMKKFTGYRQKRFKPVNTQRLERWLGADKVEHLRLCMKGWYGSPIHLTDVPGNVWVDADGDFVGAFNRGTFFNAADAFEVWLKLLVKESGRLQPATLGAGFSSISDALARATNGFSQRRNFQKTGSTGVVSVSSSLWRVGNQPAGGAAGAAAPGGTVHNNTNTGALTFANPAVGANRLVGADIGCNNSGNTLLLYDRLFSVAVNMNSTAAQAVTGVPNRYQSTDALSANEDYIGDNFMFFEVGGTALAATAHNYTGCTYLDETNASSTLPNLTGNSGAIVNRLDHPINQWFAPLASGDSGIKALTNIQLSAAVATGLCNAVIGHPIGFMTFLTTTGLMPFDWLTNRDQAPKITNDACLAFLECIKPSTSATSYTGRIAVTSTSS